MNGVSVLLSGKEAALSPGEDTARGRLSASQEGALIRTRHAGTQISDF